MNDVIIFDSTLLKVAQYFLPRACTLSEDMMMLYHADVYENVSPVRVKFISLRRHANINS